MRRLKNRGLKSPIYKETKPETSSKNFINDGTNKKAAKLAAFGLTPTKNVELATGLIELRQVAGLPV